MTASLRPGQRARITLGLIILSTFSTTAFAADNIWRSTFGQGWFYEVGSSSNQVLAGSWWEQSLTPGNTYRVTFNVKSLRGRIGVLMGGNPVFSVSKPGTYGFDFKVAEGGKRRMLFRTLTSNVAAAVNHISVTQKGDSSAQGTGNDGGVNWIPKGHYLSFARKRNFKTEVLDPMAHRTGHSNYHLKVARDLDEAFRTPGVKGIWMEFDWRSLEVGDGVYDWRLLDQNMAVARQYGLKFIVKVADRSFDGTNVLPRYFPSRYVIWSSDYGNSGVVAKRWDPYVYNRLIRLYKAIAHRYANDAAFGGVATTETAVGNFSGGDYSLSKYMTALTQIVTQTEPAMKRGRLFLYLNFLKGGVNMDMNKDARAKLLASVPHGALVVGGPDITPDVQGMPRSMTNFRIHTRKTMPGTSQFCHLQHVDQGRGNRNVKSNRYRQKYYDDAAALRRRESGRWFKGEPAVMEFDDLRAPNGSKVALHPSSVLGTPWKPEELLRFGVRNFRCDYVFWHYRERPEPSEFGWQDVQPVIRNNQYFYN